MGGTPKYYLRFFCPERRAPACVQRFLADLQGRKITDREDDEGWGQVQGELQYCVDPLEPEGIFKEYGERYHDVDAGMNPQTKSSTGDGVIRCRFVVQLFAWSSGDYLDELLEKAYRRPEYREAVEYLMDQRWELEWEFRDQWGSDSTVRESYREWAGLRFEEG